MSHDLHKIRVQESLVPRREPYWSAPLAAGRYLGLRKLAKGARWVARVRTDDGRQRYRALGPATTAFQFTDARREAEAWFRTIDAGVDQSNLTVEQVCRAYVQDRRHAKGEATANDAEKRFQRTVYGKKLGSVIGVKLRSSHIREWRDALSLSSGSSNRTRRALIAALNFAVRNRMIPAERAIEWQCVPPLREQGGRRTTYLDRSQRRALLESAGDSAFRDLLEAAMYTGARVGEIVRAKCHQFDVRTGSMTFIGKTGQRSVELHPIAQKLFARRATGRSPSEWIFTRDDGSPWGHSDWDHLMRDAVSRAELPTETILYTLRHSYITQAITEGVSTLAVARLTGTSLAMIDKHYGHLCQRDVRERLARIEFS